MRPGTEFRAFGGMRFFWDRITAGQKKPDTTARLSFGFREGQARIQYPDLVARSPSSPSCGLEVARGRTGAALSLLADPLG